jgi:two-component system CheB/CheR fusion protein
LPYGLDELLAARGVSVRPYAAGAAVLAEPLPWSATCIVVDMRSPALGGSDLFSGLGEPRGRLPTVAITPHGDVEAAVHAMRAGALDCVEAPVERSDLLACIERALARSRDMTRQARRRQEMAAGLASLTPRQRQIMDLVLAGQPSKNIAVDLGISRRTVESHRAAIMRKTGAGSLPFLAQLVLAAAPPGEASIAPGVASSSDPEALTPDGQAAAAGEPPPARPAGNSPGAAAEDV